MGAVHGQQGKSLSDKKVVRIELADGSSESFHIAWLRDSCQCSKCIHPITRQKLFNPAFISLDLLSPAEIKNDGKSLHVKWKHGNSNSDNHANNYHESCYSLQWLTKFRGKFMDFTWSTKDYPADCIYQPLEVLEAVHWNVDSIKKIDLTKEYTQIMESDTHLKEFLRKLCTLGIALIKNAPIEKGTVLKVAQRIAYTRPSGYGTTFDVVTDPDPSAHFAYKSEALTLHTDLSYRERSPGTQLLHCIRNADSEGFSLFSDGLRAASMLRSQSPSLFQVLTKPVMFSFLDSKRNRWYREKWPIIVTESTGEIKEVNLSVFSMRPPLLSPNEIDKFYRAFKTFHDLASCEANQWQFLMQPGDIIMFHNRRVFHGRTGFDPNKSNRFLQGCYIDWDEIVATYEALAE